MSTLKITAQHLTSSAVFAELSATESEGRTMSDACAVTLASWYASPGRDGAAFAALSTGAPTTTTAVRDNIRETAVTQREDVRALAMLRAWVDSKITEHYVIGRNIAGYLPESEPTCFADDYAAAVEALADDMREYADDDDDQFPMMRDASISDPITVCCARDAADCDCGSMRAAVDSIIRDEIIASHRAHGTELDFLVEDGSGRMISFWLYTVPASECEEDHDDI